MLTAVLLTALAGDALADERQAKAHALMDEGAALIDKKREAEGYEKFKEAYSIYPSPNYLFAMATSEQALGRPLEALRHYRQALQDPTLFTKNADRAKIAIAQLESKFGRIVVNAPPDSVLTIDGSKYDRKLDQPIDVDPGSHTFVATKGDRQASGTINVAAGHEETLTLAFPPEGAPLPDPSSPLPPSVEPSTEPRTERSRLGVAVPIALGALAVVSASFGVGFLVDSNVKANRARDFNRRYSGGACNATTEACQSYDLKSDAASRSRTVSTVAFIGAGALAAGAIATFLFWPKGSERRVGTGSTPSLRVIPLVGSTIGMQGIF